MYDSHLLRLIAETPRMQPVDAVKLAYQSAFGCGHLLPAEADAEALLQAELNATPVNPAIPAAVPIGGGFCRVNLASPVAREAGARRIVGMMLATERYARPSAERFEQGVNQLVRLAREGRAPFDPQALIDCAEACRLSGYAPVGHSEAYRAAYAPAYRVALEDYGTLLPVVAEIERQLRDTGRAVVALDGMCGAGKTTLANALGALYHTQPIHMDDFFLPFDLRTPERLSQPGGNVHYERFLAEVLAGLERGGDVAYHRFDCHTGESLERTHHAGEVTLIEGTYSHHPAFNEAYRRLNAFRVLVATDKDEQLRRLRRRDPDALETFQNRWIPLEKSYFLAYDRNCRADIALVSQPWEDEP